jgi:hypothetical protein
MRRFKPPIVGQYTQSAVFSRWGLTLASGNPKIEGIFAFPSRRGFVGRERQRNRRVAAPSFSLKPVIYGLQFALSLSSSASAVNG